MQLYVNDVISSIMTPVKELKGFKKVQINAGDTKNVSITLSVSDFSIVDADEQYVVELGEFEIMVGQDSRNANLLKEILTVG
ncbi:fibronectin type III-like domain-contianing protein [Clostridium sp.]|uniref:fibronectin type III-like domain-contianing protein n=1 Tax=Clostridium sp. TaxID=1506 RepID=UPI00261181F8|nr:fibronectin type III-like domain-contianing protein [uncultured Clostridium sp.]